MKASSVIGSLVFIGAASFGISHLLKTNSTGKKISVSITGVNTPKLKGGSLVLGVDVALDNPTSQTLNLKKPYLTAFINAKEVGNSFPSSEIIPIKANGRTKITGISLEIPVSKIGVDALKFFASGKLPKLSVDIKMKTEANGIPYSDTQHFDL